MNATIPAGAIVVGVDGSESSNAALHRASSIASALERPLVPMITWSYPNGAGFVGSWSPEEDAQATMDEALATVFPAGVPEGATVVVREGTPAKTLIGASREAYMLVLGSRGHGGFFGLILGSVSTACAEHAPCPVLIMHGDGDGGTE